MGIINRNLGSSQRRGMPFEFSAGAVATGVTQIIATIPYPCSVDGAQMFAFGTSGAPTVQLFVNRFIIGTGFTTFSLASAQSVPAYGTSGVLASGYSLPQIGSTLTQLFINDVVMVQTGGANSAVTGLAIGLVLRPIADTLAHYGVI